ncbi:MAG: hypothetical protein RSB98_00825 [Raoultibacter sp.]
MADFDLSGIISDSMRECIEDNEEALAENCKAAGARSVKLLKQKSKQRTGLYKKGWKSNVAADETGTECVVHNRVYQLTHLLENDHVIKNQTGKSYGMARGDGLMSDVFEQVSAEFVSGSEAR